MAFAGTVPLIVVGRGVSDIEISLRRNGRDASTVPHIGRQLSRLQNRPKCSLLGYGTSGTLESRAIEGISRLSYWNLRLNLLITNQNFPQKGNLFKDQ